MTARPAAAPPERHPALVNLALTAAGFGLFGGLLWLIGHIGSAAP